MMKNKVCLVRRATFSSARAFRNPTLSPDENRKLFGSFYRDDGFGHNFTLEVGLSGPIDPLTGMILNLVDVDESLRLVLKNWDHRDLNEHPAFRTTVPSLEKMASELYQEISNAILRLDGPQTARLDWVKVGEGLEWSAEYWGV